MGRRLFVELCAGSAAVSLRLLSSRAKPPIGYQGGKRGYASAILQAMGLAPGQGGREGWDILLVEPGPWGEAWALWRTAEGRRDTCERLRAWAGEDPRELWERLRAAPVPADAVERVATWAALQYWNFRGKPVAITADAWVTHGLHPDVNAARYGEAYVAPDGRTWARTDRRLPFVVNTVDELPDLARVAVVVSDARAVAPIPGALCYIDPDYQGTTGYGPYSLPRADVLDVAQRWRNEGAHVAVSEGEPLPLTGWSAHRLPPPVGRGRTFSAQQSEYLTLSREPRGQMGLAL